MTDHETFRLPKATTTGSKGLPPSPPLFPASQGNSAAWGGQPGSCSAPEALAWLPRSGGERCHPPHTPTPCNQNTFTSPCITPRCPAGPQLPGSRLLLPQPWHFSPAPSVADSQTQHGHPAVASSLSPSTQSPAYSRCIISASAESRVGKEAKEQGRSPGKGQATPSLRVPPSCGTGRAVGDPAHLLLYLEKLRQACQPTNSRGPSSQKESPHTPAHPRGTRGPEPVSLS